MRSIALTGFMASGKTEIGKAIQRMSGLELVDTDSLIEKREGKTINEIFAQMGEEYFRTVESEAVESVSEKDGLIISTGGGVVMRAENVDMLRRGADVYFIDTKFEIIEERIKYASITRPLLKGQTIAQIKDRYDFRRSYYLNCDHVIKIIDNRSPEVYAKEILDIHCVSSERK